MKVKLRGCLSLATLYFEIMSSAFFTGTRCASPALIVDGIKASTERNLPEPIAGDILVHPPLM